MATKSILKDVVIKDRHLASSFINALESAETHPYKRPEKTLEVQEASKETIKDLFGCDETAH